MKKEIFVQIFRASAFYSIFKCYNVLWCKIGEKIALS